MGSLLVPIGYVNYTRTTVSGVQSAFSKNIRTYFETVFVHGWVGVGHAQERVHRPAGENGPIDGAGQLARFYAHRRSGHRHQAVVL